ncbi:MAG: prolipoprotein diacylglyceryl transferase family protein [Candidatus Babeliaceae bacterium]|jgi:phosphatidylglycerol:prolipoprotein diacylglycerol transferase
MHPIILHIYGPFSIHSYGLAIFIGFSLFFFLTKRAALEKKLVTEDSAYSIAQHCVFAAVIMGRLVHFLSERENYTDWYDLISFWDGGFSILGAMIGVFAYAPFILRIYQVPFLRMFDTGALYVALLHVWGRIGCFCAGCCGGIATNSILGVIYTNPQSNAPLHIKIHPTQLYSALIFFSIFIILRYICPRYCTKPGQITALYLILASAERFIIDFIRNDRIPMVLFSFHQWLALAVMGMALLGFIYCSYQKQHTAIYSQ